MNFFISSEANLENFKVLISRDVILRRNRNLEKKYFRFLSVQLETRRKRV